MKYKHKALVCLTLLVPIAPIAAMAQTAMGSTGIVFYGKVDLALDSTHFSSTPTSPAVTARYLSNDISYWGLRGTEDLGDNTAAYFKLESGFSADTGANTGGTSQFFDRESFLGYKGNWGSVQLGNQWTPSLYVQARSDPYSRQANGSGVTLTQQTPSNVRGFLGAVTQPNAIQYISPTYAGVTGHVMYGLAEKTVAPTSVGSLSDVSLDYFNGRLYLGASYEDQVLATAPVGGTLANRTLALGGTYDFSFIKLFGYAMKNTLTNANGVRAYLVGLNYPMGPATIKTTFAQRKIDSTNGGNTNLFAIGYYYDLSVRTTLYTSVGYVNNGAATNFGLWPSSKTYSPPVVAGGSGLPIGGQNVSSVEFGIRHVF